MPFDRVSPAQANVSEHSPTEPSRVSWSATPKHKEAISFRAVNGWRGPGALAIAVAHFAVATDFVAIHYLEPIALVVDLFFVLSGLLISQAYGEKIRRPSDIPEYVVRRFGRIWPVQAATLALLVGYELMKLAAYMATGKQFSSPAFSSAGLNLVEAIPTNLFLVHSLGIHDRETWNFPSWSLSVEFFTYIVFAVFCLFSPTLRRTFAVAAIIISLAILIYVAPYQMRSTFDYGIFRCLAGFFAGSLCYEVVRRWSLHSLPMPTLIEVAAIVLLGFWLSVAVGSYWAFAAPFVICLFLSAFLNGQGLVSRILSTKPMQFWADLSFTIYMVHAIVLTFFLAALHEWERLSGKTLFFTAPNPLAGHPGAFPTIRIIHLDNDIAKWALGIGYVTAVLLLAYAAHRFVENPGRSLFGKIAKRVARTPFMSRSRTASIEDPMEAAP